MIAVLQRATSAAVRVDGKVTGAIEKGLLILLGVAKGDTREEAALLATKIAACRIFRDENDKMNLSVRDIGGSALVISNFTLLADYSHGNRPSYFEAAAPAEAEALYLEFSELLRKAGVPTENGVFGAHMKISLDADGPVTIVMDSAKLKGRKEKNA